MAKKLIATEFDYTVDSDYHRRPTREHGSYLGKKAATVRTIKKFLYRNAKGLLPNPKYSNIEVSGSYVSPWIAQ